jgi:flagellar biosynthesis GTPase FlhF
MFNSEVNYFGLTNYRNQFRKFGIKTDDRRRHMYVIGKTGMGKTTILENMVLNDIYAGHGIGLVDPHGDFAEKVLNYIPPHRINDIVYFNPSDLECPVGFNVLESINEEYRHLVASGLMGVFKKIWPDVWSARMEYIMNNSILALIGYPDATLMGINRMLSDEDYRDKVISVVKDPVVKAFWDVEFASYSDKYKQEAVAPIQNKIGQFLSASVIRNIVAQVKSTINIREIMDTRKIFIMNLSKGRIGEDSSRLLGGMLITKIQLSAMERVDTPEKERKDFFLYVDEFQNFATESFSNILSEARKYRLDLIMAHQYMEQLEEGVRAAVIGNVGSMVMFRVGSTDADILAKEFAPTFTEEDLVNLPKFHVYLKLMIDGVASRPFSALTLPPIAAATGSLEKVLRVSRERYGTPRATIEEKIAKWSGVFETKEPTSGGGSAGGNTGASKNFSKPSSGNKSGGKPGGGKSNGPSKNFSGNSKPASKPLPPRSSPPPNITTNPAAPAQPVTLVDSEQTGVSLSQISKINPPASPPLPPPSSPQIQNLPQSAQPELVKDQKIISTPSNQDNNSTQPTSIRPQPANNPPAQPQQKNTFVSPPPKNQSERPSQSPPSQQPKQSSQSTSNQSRKPQQKQTPQPPRTSPPQNSSKNSQNKQFSALPPKPSQQETQGTKHTQSSDRRSEKQNTSIPALPRSDNKNNEQKSEKTVSLQELSKNKAESPRSNLKPQAPPPSSPPQPAVPPPNNSLSVNIQPKTLSPGEVARIE